MMGSARNGALVIIIVGGIIYFSGAGNWALSRLKGLDSACYSGLARVGVQAANPVCAMITKAGVSIGEFGDSIGRQIDQWQYRLFGSNGIDKLRAIADGLGHEVNHLASSGDALARFMSAGPSSLANSGQQSFQQAVDGFAIGQGFLKRGSGLQALPWLTQGAQQPQGYGVMSQLTLGHLYANGGLGIPTNPQRAEFYLNQAQQSLATLLASNSPQSEKILSSLPAKPQKIQTDLQRAILEIRASRL